MAKKDDKQKDLTPDAPETNEAATGLVKVRVRALAERRCRAGRCYGPEEEEVEVSEYALELLLADPLLKVTVI